MIWMMSREEDCSIYSEKFKLQVIEAHRRFFEKRGIDPDNIPGISDYKFQWWKKTSVPPIVQCPPGTYPPAYSVKQKNA